LLQGRNFPRSNEYDKKHGIGNADKKKSIGESVPSVSGMKPADKRKQEFLAAMGAGKGTTKFWANDDAVSVPEESVAVEPQDSKLSKGNSTPVSQGDGGDVENNDDEDESSVASDDSGGQGADVMKLSEPRKMA
jgi:hypothetical protein